MKISVNEELIYMRHRISESRKAQDSTCSWQNTWQNYTRKAGKPVFSFYASWLSLLPKGSDGDEKPLLCPHSRVCFASTRKVFHQVRLVFWALISVLWKSEEIKDYCQTSFSIFPYVTRDWGCRNPLILLRSEWPEEEPLWWPRLSGTMEHLTLKV